MAPSLRRARAAALLAALAFARFAWPEADPVLAPCPDPREARAERGHTRVVDCRPRASGPPLRGPARLLFGLGLDPNRADAETLAALPGIGPARAEAIVAGRAEGPYRQAEDLSRIHGIGPKTVERLRPWLRFAAGPDREAGLQERR